MSSALINVKRSSFDRIIFRKHQCQEEGDGT